MGGLPNDLKKKLTAEGYFEVSEKIGQLKMVAPEGRGLTRIRSGNMEPAGIVLIDFRHSVNQKEKGDE